MTSLLLRLITELLEETTATTSALDGLVPRPRVSVMVARAMQIIAPRCNASERENTRRLVISSVARCTDSPNDRRRPETD
jgi:hypothetical protein